MVFFLFFALFNPSFLLYKLRKVKDLQLLEDMILKYGQVCDGDVLKVGFFFNQQIDMNLASEIGKELKQRFENCGVTKVLTIEASGIVMAYATAQAIGVPMVFAKKTQSNNDFGDVYTANVVSYTRGKSYSITVPCAYLSPDDKVLIVDDFLATGNALLGLIGIVNAAGAKVVGVGIGIEKAYQGGGKDIRALGIRIESLAKIAEMSPEKGVIFCH